MASAAVVLVFMCLFLSSLSSEAREHLVGGKSDAWKIPSSESDSLNHWAEKSRFLVGDSLVWEYKDSKDSVLQVNRRDYVTCNTTRPIETHSGNGNVKMELSHSGPYYFISGAEGHCVKGQKLIVVVMSEKHRRFMAVSPTPAGAEVPAVAPAPTSGAGVLRAGALGVAAMGVLLML